MRLFFLSFFLLSVAPGDCESEPRIPDPQNVSKGYPGKDMDYILYAALIGFVFVAGSLSVCAVFTHHYLKKYRRAQENLERAERGEPSIEEENNVDKEKPDVWNQSLNNPYALTF